MLKKLSIHKKYLYFLLSFILVTSLIGIVTPAVHVYAADMDRPGWILAWNDEFNGASLDRTKWDPWFPDQAGYFIHDSGSNDGMNPNNVSVSGGTLKLKFSKDPITIGNQTVQYSTGAVTTRNAPYSFKYGYIEARMNFNNLGGAFWLLPDEGSETLSGAGSEVDIIECYSGATQIDNCFHWGGYGAYHQADSCFYNPSDILNGWHKFAVEWDADVIKFYYDDKLVRIKYGAGVPQDFEHIVFNVGGGPDSMLPANCEVDYVRVYQKNGTTQETHPLNYYGEYTANPGFETGNLTGWGSSYGVVSVINSNQHSGSYCARVAGGSAAQQVITGLTEGKTYKVGAYVKVDSGETAYLGLNNIDLLYPSNQVYITTTSTSYVYLTFTFKLGNYNRVATLYLWSPGGSGNCYVDDVSVVEESNICLDNPASASTVNSLAEQPQCSVDGNEFSTYATKWCSATWTGSPEWLQVDLRKNQTINRWVVVHAGSNESWGTQSLNTRDFSLQYSTDGINWSIADSVTGNTANATNREFTAVTARYVRLYITNPQTEVTGQHARIYEFKVFPQTISGAPSQPVLPSPSWMPAPTPMPNLMINGSFETGNLTGWSSNYGTVSITTSNPYDGTYCVQVSPGSAAQQTVLGLIPNTTYVLTGEIVGASPNMAYLGINNYGGTGQLYAINSLGWWTPYTITFTTGPSSTSALIYVWGPGTNTGCIWGDAISVVKYRDLTKVNDSQTGTDQNQFEKSGNWSTTIGESGCYYGDHIWSNTTNNYYQVRFVGTAASLYVTKDNNEGIAALSIDGGAESDVDMYSLTRQRQALVYTSPDLTYGQHIIKVRVKGSKNASSSGYNVDGDMVLVSGDHKTINNSLSGTEISEFNYSGTWTPTTGDSVALNGDYQSSNTTNNYYQVQFSGTIAKLYATTNNYEGITAVSIDGGTETNVDMYSASKTGQVLLYTSQVLSPGVHTIKVRVTGTKNASSTGYSIMADRLDIFQ